MSEVSKLCSCDSLPTLPALPEREASLSAQTRQELISLKEQILQWAPCAPDPMTVTPVDDEKHFRYEDVKACTAMENGYMILGGCMEGTYWDYCSYYGNTNNYAGPLCLAGDEARCQDIIKNQDPVTGAWYRSAFQRRFPLSERGQPLFSRDEVLGVLMYLAKTKDKEAASKWLTFIAKNPKKYLTGTGKLIKVFNFCPSHGVSERPANIPESQWKGMQPDDRCEMRGNTWGLMYKVYKFIGFTDQELIGINAQIYASMKSMAPTVAPTAAISVYGVPRIGYQAALEVSNVFLYHYISGTNNGIMNSAGRAVNKRTEYESPFYHYVAMGSKPTEYGAQLIKKYCPTKMPNYAKPPQGGIGTPAASFYDSVVHYFGGLKDNWQANLPTGHECIGWINLYLNERSPH